MRTTFGCSKLILFKKLYLLRNNLHLVIRLTSCDRPHIRVGLEGSWGQSLSSLNFFLHKPLLMLKANLCPCIFCKQNVTYHYLRKNGICESSDPLHLFTLKVGSNCPLNYINELLWQLIPQWHEPHCPCYEKTLRLKQNNLQFISSDK